MKPFSAVKYLFILLIASAACAAAPQKADSSKAKVQSIIDATKSCKKFDGLFPIYQDTTTGSAYIQIAANQIGKEFIYFSFTVDGVADAYQIRGSFRSDEIFSIHKYFNHIEFQVNNTSYYFDSTNALHRAAGANVNNPILASEKITAEDSAQTEYLIPADGLFLAENFEQVKPSPFPGAFGAGAFSLGMLDKDKTKYNAIRNYPANTDVIVEYVYDNPAPTNGGGTDVTDARYVSIKIQHSLIEVPHNNFKPRYDDPRVGFFTNEVDDMTSTSATPYRDVIHRWNLEKKYPDSALSDPVKPITFWIENTTPMEFRETIKAAGLAWNEAFEQAGFKNAIDIEVQPDTATWDAGDIRYNVLRWVSSPQPAYGGYGPSFVNPRTGEILGADIMLEYVFMTNRLRQEKLFQPSALEAMDQIRENKNYLPFPKTNDQLCDLGDELHNSTLFGLTALNAMGFSEIQKKELLKESLYYLVLHEMGHTLGLMHNMKASQLWSPAQINDTALTHKIGLTCSVMDYPAVNISPDKNKQGQYMTTKPGPYDKWAIEYGYSPALADETAEHDRLEKILSRSTDPQLAFGNDADDMRMPGFGIDPRVMIGDMSNDAITYSIGRMQIVDSVMKTIKEKYNTPGQSYQELRNAYVLLTGEYAVAAGVISRYIGGVYVDRAFIGQPGATKPFVPVSYNDQKRAMSALATYLFGVNAFKIDGDLYNYVQRQRRGYSNFGIGNEDPKVTDRVLSIQRGVLFELLHPIVLKRIVDTRMYGNTYGLGEYMTDLTDAIFKDDAKTDVNVFRQNLQKEYVTWLIQIVKSQGGMYDEPAQAMALHSLKSIQSLVTKAKSSDVLTQAHRENLALEIQKALSAKEG
jgi:hypothetical protein